MGSEVGAQRQGCVGVRGGGLGEFQHQVFQREAPKRPEIVGTLGISNPVWSLFGQLRYQSLSTLRSLSSKIKREGRLHF